MAAILTLSETEVPDSASNIQIGEAQRKLEQTPSDPILPPQPSGSYEVDESVRACESGLSYISRSLNSPRIVASFSSSRIKDYSRAQLWHVFVGENCKNRRSIALWRGEKLLSKG